MMKNYLAHKGAVIYKRRIAANGQSCRFEAEMTNFEVVKEWSPGVPKEEKESKIFLLPYLAVGFSNRQFDKYDNLQKALPVTGSIGVAGLKWGLDQINKIKKFGFPVLVCSDFGEPRRLKAYLRLIKHGFRLKYVNHDKNIVYDTDWLTPENAAMYSDCCCLLYQQ